VTQTGHGSAAEARPSGHNLAVPRGRHVLVWLRRSRLVPLARRRCDTVHDRGSRLGAEPDGWAQSGVLRPDLPSAISRGQQRGRATIATADDDATVEEAKAITRRCMAPEEVDDYVAEWTDLRTIVTVVPDRIVSWSAGGW